MSAVAEHTTARGASSDVGRLLARCAFEGVLVHVCGGRLRVRTAGENPFLATLSARKAEVIEHLRAHPPPVFLDFETLSQAKLTSIGGRRYANDPTTEVLCAVALLPDGELLPWRPGDAPPEHLFAAAESAGLVAHNAQLFDRWVWERTLKWPSGPRWEDSVELARVSGFDSASLEALARLMPRAAKDHEGSELAVALNRRYARTGLRPEIGDDERERIVAYCLSDVLLMARVYRGLLHGASRVEPDVRDANATIQRRGFAFDRELARAIVDTSERIAAHLATPGVPLRSAAKLSEWLEAHGVRVGKGKGALEAAALQRIAGRPDVSPEVRRVLDARLFDAAIGVKKLRAALRDTDEDGRIREPLRYSAAHTGRWTAVGFQPHNLPKPPKGLDAEATERAIGLARARDVDGLLALAGERAVRPEEVIGALVRPCIVAPRGRVLGVVDYAQIEARVLLWLAGDADGMRAFRDGEDVYARMAERLYGLELGAIDKGDPRRLLGKVATLGLGYGMGAPRFRATAESNGVDWNAAQAAGLSPDAVVERWRDGNARVAGERCDGESFRVGGLWQRLNSAAKRAVRDRTPIAVGPLAWRMQGPDLLCRLPSRRFLRYPEAKLERAEGRPYASVFFRGRKYRRAGYGGLWTENAVQAIARDLLAAALVRLERAGLPVVLHVHDEIVCELERESDLARMIGLCEELPAWAEGLPVKAEGFTSERYRKG